MTSFLEIQITSYIYIQEVTKNYCTIKNYFEHKLVFT